MLTPVTQSPPFLLSSPAGARVRAATAAARVPGRATCLLALLPEATGCRPLQSSASDSPAWLPSLAPWRTLLEGAHRFSSDPGRPNAQPLAKKMDTTLCLHLYAVSSSPPLSHAAAASSPASLHSSFLRILLVPFLSVLMSSVVHCFCSAARMSVVRDFRMCVSRCSELLQEALRLPKIGATRT